MREAFLEAARTRGHGLHVLTFEQLAARLAGGFARPVDNDTLLAAVRDALISTKLGALDEIKVLPGMAHAAAETLRKTWRAGIDLQSRAGQHPRIAAIAALESAVTDRLPIGMLRPAALVAAAAARIDFARALFGPIEVVGLTELSPVWRPLLRRLAEMIPVTWVAGPRDVPGWLDGCAVTVVRSPASSPGISLVSAATALHEVIEGIRWARELVATGRAEPQQIAIAATGTSNYDDYFVALRADANFEIHFVHGVRAVTTRHGQAAAALADILVRGLSQNRVRRLARFAEGPASPFASLPDGWTRILPEDAPLRSLDKWRRTLASVPAATWPGGADRSEALLRLLEILNRGTSTAEEVGEAFLSGRALAIWRKALLRSPHSAVDTAVDALRIDDSLDASVSIAWMPAESLAASPRKFVRLLGLTSRGWPRQVSEDRLLSDHIVPTSELDPLPVSAADRRDFETILRTTEAQVVLSRPRRDSEGRLLGKSPLLHGQAQETYLSRTRTPQHAMSETDRLLARPHEFAQAGQAQSAAACWRDWSENTISAHDGLMRANHPAIEAVLARIQSASSLRMLLRDPLGFVWKYGLGMRAAEIEEEPLVLDSRMFGNLVHGLLERAVQLIETRGGLARAVPAAVEAVMAEVVPTVRTEWEAQMAIPPTVIWRRTLAEAASLSTAALSHPDVPLDGQRSYAEVRFGSAEEGKSEAAPWDPQQPVEIPDTGLRVGGFIDRIDLSGDGRSARVRDYKTGKPPRNPIVLDGGKELQRCLYAFAVKALLGHDVTVDASLLYLRDGLLLRMENSDQILDSLKAYLSAARANLAAGAAVPGPDSSDQYNELAFALPANASKNYCRRKETVAAALLGTAISVWEAP